MSKAISRRNVLTAATAAAAALTASAPAVAQAELPAPELREMQERLLAARAEQDRLLTIVHAAERKRPPIPASIEREDFKGHYYGAREWHQRGRFDLAKIAKAYEAERKAADLASGFWQHNEAYARSQKSKRRSWISSRASSPISEYRSSSPSIRKLSMAACLTGCRC